MGFVMLFGQQWQMVAFLFLNFSQVVWERYEDFDYACLSTQQFQAVSVGYKILNRMNNSQSESRGA
jgi:hypothetical protein